MATPKKQTPAKQSKPRAKTRQVKASDHERKMLDIQQSTVENMRLLTDAYRKAQLAALNADPVAAAGDCNPCFEQSAGLLTCDGSNPVVVPFPADGKWVVAVINGQLKLLNGAGIIPDEDASEPTAPDDEPMPPPPGPATE